MQRFAVIGLGRFGKRLATKLAEAGAEVIAVDRDRQLVEAVRDRVALAVCLDSLDADALRSQGIDRVDVAVVGMGTSFEDTALTTVILKKLGVKRVVSRATSQIRGEILENLQADEVVNPEREAADRWCNYLMAPSVIERIPVAADHTLVQLPAPVVFHGKSLAQLGVRTKYKVNVVAIRRIVETKDDEGKIVSQKEDVLVAMPDTVIQSGDILFMIGRDEDITNFPTT